MLTHSYSAKLLAVRIVTQNLGKRTAGVDGELWTTASDKMRAALSLCGQHLVSQTDTIEHIHYAVFLSPNQENLPNVLCLSLL
jgi:hypothetical protein